MKIKRRNAFTLIELLIVVAIIAILAGIAVPNFLEAQVRAKVSRVMTDLRSFATGLEAYAVDHTTYPIHGRVAQNGTIQFPATVNDEADITAFVSPILTTPVAYITTLFEDPFMDRSLPTVSRQYEYLNMRQFVNNFPRPFPQPWMGEQVIWWGEWRLLGAGPDQDRGLDIKYNIVYDPTNGTISDGDIVRTQISCENAACCRFYR